MIDTSSVFPKKHLATEFTEDPKESGMECNPAPSPTGVVGISVISVSSVAKNAVSG
jgi:hypothetical protein